MAHRPSAQRVQAVYALAVLALLIGITSGTYSSIFNASLLLYSWQTGEVAGWFGRRPKQVAVPA